MISVISLLLLSACENEFNVPAREATDGSCWVSLEEYVSVAETLREIEQAELVVEIPPFRLLTDNAGRRYARIDGDGRVHVRLSYIHKSVPLELNNLFHVQEVPPEPCPVCFDPWNLRLGIRAGGGFYGFTPYFLLDTFGTVNLNLNQFFGFDLTLNAQANTRLLPNWFDIRLAGGVYLEF